MICGDGDFLAELYSIAGSSLIDLPRVLTKGRLIRTPFGSSVMG